MVVRFQRVCSVLVKSVEMEWFAGLSYCFPKVDCSFDEK
jgi:hypothetical protein